MRLNTSTDYAILTLMHLAASGKVVSSAELESHINGYMQMMTLDVLTKKSKTEWRELVSNMAIQYAKECSDDAP